MARIHCSIDVVTALQEHNVKKLSNLGGAKNIKLQMFEAAAKHGGRNISWRGDSIVLCLFYCCPACGLRMDRFQLGSSNLTFSIEIRFWDKIKILHVSELGKKCE